MSQLSVSSFLSLLFLALVITGCPKKETTERIVYTPPPIDWEEDEDLDDLPEAEEEKEDPEE